jgi:hypothetical protein
VFSGRHADRGVLPRLSVTALQRADDCVHPEGEDPLQADYTLPAAGQQPNDHIKALQAALGKLNLDFDKYLSVHREAAPQTKSDVLNAGK